MKTWTEKYHTHEAFLANFLTEQEYIDAMFIFIVMYNFGIALDSDDLLADRVAFQAKR